MSWGEEIGGVVGMRRVLQDFYGRLLKDPMVGFFFAGKNVSELVERQLTFTARALGAPVAYSGRSIREAHARLPILPGHFDRRHRLLEETLDAHQVSEPLRSEWLKLDLALRHVVVKAVVPQVDS